MINRIAIFRLLTVFSLALAAFPVAAPAPRVAEAQTDNCSALTGIINDYWPGTNSPAAGTTTIQLGARRAGGKGMTIAPGDMLLVIQVMGADINYTNTADYGDGPGGLTGSGFISNTNFVAGRYEYVEAVNSVGVSGGTLTIRGNGAGGGLVNSYVNANATATTGPRRFQVVRVPKCATASLSGNLTAVAFDGFSGGILALDVTGQLSLNNRTMDVSGLGYRGGGEGNVWGFCYRALYYVVSNPYVPGPTHCHAPKGEGFAGSPELVRIGSGSTSVPASNHIPGGSWATGAPANGGGGGTLGNSGGGGGGNGGSGGKGNWGSNLTGGDRIDNGGFGGAPFPASFGVSRIVMGGGGGSGEGDTVDGYGPTFGGGGGGIVLVRAGSVQGNGTVLADGQAGLGNTATDAGGGGGAGGTIVFAAQSGPLSGVSLYARGGKGGDASSYCHMVGGGGGGGRIFYSHTPATANVSAGPRGTGGCPDPVPLATNGSGATISPNDIPGCSLGGCLAVSKQSPANGASGQPANLSLTWNTATGGTVDHYRYCVSMTPGCAPATSNGTSTSAAVSLLPGATYYWQVRACADSGCAIFADADGGTHWSFSTAADSGFVKSAPSNGATNQPVSGLSLSWTTAANATRYELCYDTTVNGACNGTWQDMSTATNTTLSGLTANTTYEWQVRACNATGCNAGANNGTWWTFTTAAAPGSFGKSSPSNGASGQPANLTLSWGAATGVNHYRYCYATTIGCTPSTSNGTATNANLTGLTPGATYHWQVRACADSGCTVFTDANGSSGHWSFTVASAPGSFGKSSPANGASNQPTALNLQWNAATGVNHYRYCFSTSNGCTPNVNVGTNLNAALSGLTPGATYYWQVRACADSGCTVFTDANGVNAHWNFTVVSAPSGSGFSKVSPAHTALNQPTNLTLSWNAAGGVVDKYEYCVSTTASCSAWTDVGLNTSATVAGLTAGTQYYWQARACNSAGCTEANSGSFWAFQTAATVGSFNKFAPGNSAINVNTNTAQLLWTTAANATDYKLCLGTAVNNCNVVGGGVGQFASVGNTYFRVLSDLPLQPNTTYYWQVLATNGTYTTSANGSALAFWSFTTLPNWPYPFNKLSPSFNATNVPTQNVPFQWQAASGAVSYTLCVGAFAGDCSYSVVVNSGTSAVLAGPLPAGATLVWQVTAHNAGGSTNADNGTWWPFTTLPNAPQAFTKINPPDNATGQPLGVNLTWQDTPDETYYSVCVGTSIGVCSLVNTTTTQNVASYALTGLDYGAQYFWQVSACNAGGCTPANNGVAWGFKTLNPPVPGPFQKTHPANGAVGAPTNPAVLQLTWTAASDADGYEVCMGTAPGACDLSGGGFQDVGPVTARFINQLPFSVTLQSGTTYYWQVRAYSTLTATRTFADNGVDFYFVTQSSGGPAAFSKDAPLNGSFNLPTASLTLRWFAAGGATSYDVCAGSAPGLCNAMPGNTWLNVGSALSYTLTNLDPGTNYFWQVRALNGSGATPANGGAWWQFSTQNDFPPAAFAKQAPAHLATNVVTGGLTLSWTASTGATSYRVCIGSAPGLCEATGGWVNVGNNTSWVVTPALQSATTYWWQVQALGGSFSVQADGGQWWAFTTQPDGPAAFSKQQPLQGAIGVPTATAVLSWTAALGASNYEVCLGTGAGLCDVTGTWLNVGNVTTWNPPTLSPATTYWWQVRAVNSGGRTQANGGVWWHFTTTPAFGPNPPAPFGKAMPLNNAANQPVNLTLSWNAAVGATGYQVCVGLLPSDCSATGGWVSVGGTSYALSGLSYDMTYFWQVRALNSSGTTLADGGAWWRFSTGNNPGAAASAFGKQAPLHLATGVPTATATLSWTASTGATGYRVCVGSAPGLCEATGGWESVGNVTSWTPPALNAATTYWWQVRAVGLGFDIQADGGQWWAFTTANDPAPAPGDFGKLQPLQGASSVPTATTTLSWTPSADAASYEVCVGTQAGLCDVTGNWVSAGSATSWNAPALQAAKTYWWQVRALNVSGQAQADNGAWWYFTTAAASSASAPGGFGKSAPANAASNQPVNPTLSWTPASGASSYQVCVGLLPGDCSATGGWVSVGGTSYALSGLSFDTTYWWQVRALNSSGTTLADGGVWWRFSTGNEPASPLGTFGKSAPAHMATGVATDTLLSWTAATGAQRYTVCVGHLPGLCDVMNHAEVLAPATSLTLANAQPGRTYWWQVWARDSSGAFLLADAGQWWAFTTANDTSGGPADFQKVAPISGTLVGDSPLLSWTASSGAVGYFVCVGSAWGLCDVANNATTTGLSRALSGLAPGSYWWQVTAVDADGDTTQADGGQRWQFTVVNNLLAANLDNVDTRKEVTPTRVRIGDLVTYTMVLSNSGGASATVRVSDTLAAALTLVSATPGYAQSGQTLVWENVVVPAGGTTVLTITAQANSNALSNPTVNNRVVISSYDNGEPPIVRDANPVDVEVYRAFLPIVGKPAFVFVPFVFTEP